MFWKAFDTLRKLQKERADDAETEIGFVSQPAPTPSETTPAPPAEPVATPSPMWQKRPNLSSLPPKQKRKRF